MAVTWQPATETDVENDTTLVVAINRIGDAHATNIENVLDGSEPLTAPTINDFTAAPHDHADAAGGGRLGLGALSSGNAQEGQPVVADGSGGFRVSAAQTNVPTGGVIEWWGSSLPEGGWLWCDGAAYNRQAYAALFAAIGTRAGSGDGSSTFNVPDRRGRGSIGLDDMGTAQGAADRVTDAAADTPGGSGGSETHQLTIDEMPAHTHGIRVSQSTSSGQPSGINGDIRGERGTGLQTNSVGGDMAHNNMPPWVATHFIIKT